MTESFMGISPISGPSPYTVHYITILNMYNMTSLFPSLRDFGILGAKGFLPEGVYTMYVTARGWKRDMGAWQLINQPLENSKVTHGASSHYINFDSPSIHVTSEKSVHVGWGKQNLTLGGNFQFLVRFTKDEIVQLFKLAIGETLSPEFLKEAGLTVDDAVVRDRIRSMAVAQLIDLVTSQSASEADTVGEVDTSEDGLGEAAE